MRNVFDKIHAEAILKEKTMCFLHEQIQIRNNNRTSSRLRRFAVCISFALLFIIGGFSYNLYFMHSAYVDIDVNPSIELVVNRFDKVIESNPYNDDGAAILKNINIQYMNYEDAVDKLIDTMVINGCLKSEGNFSITVQTKDENRKTNLLVGLRTVIDNSLQAHHTNVNANIFAVSEEVRIHAHDNHVTPAKYLAISELQQVDPTATFEDCREHTISEINQLIQAHCGGRHSDDTGHSREHH